MTRVAVPIAITVGVLILGIIIVMLLCICKHRHASSQSLVHGRYTTHALGTLQNSSHRQGLATPIPGNTSVGANSATMRHELPCPAYSAQDLPPDYSVVSKDNPPAYHTLMPTAPSSLPASAI